METRLAAKTRPFARFGPTVSSQSSPPLAGKNCPASPSRVWKIIELFCWLKCERVHTVERLSNCETAGKRSSGRTARRGGISHCASCALPSRARNPCRASNRLPWELPLVILWWTAALWQLGPLLQSSKTDNLIIVFGGQGCDRAIELRSTKFVRSYGHYD